MHYKVEQLITKEDRHELIDYFKSLPSNVGHIDYNLYNIDKRYLKQNPPEAIKKIEERAGRKNYSHYFVMYDQGSYTKMHTDNDDQIGLTIVTLIDTVNLVGGETIAMIPAKLSESKEGYQKGDDHKGRVVPRVIRMDVGDSVIYDRSLLHGVSEIEKGKRLVLVSWFTQ